MMSAVSTLDNRQHRKVSPASHEFQTHGRDLISSKIRLECAPKTLSRDIVSPTMLRLLTTHQANVVYASHATVVQLAAFPAHGLHVKHEADVKPE